MRTSDYYELKVSAENRVKSRERKARLAKLDAAYAAEYPSMVKGVEKRKSKGLTYTTRGRCGGGGWFRKHLV